MSMPENAGKQFSDFTELCRKLKINHFAFEKH
jgi:hypothetical protein